MRKNEISTLSLRPATPADANALSQLAWSSKAYWGYPAEWMEAWRAVLTLTPEYIVANNVFCGVESGRTVGCVAFQRRGEDCSLEHFWLEPSLIKTGRGRTLFQLAARQAAKLGMRKWMIESDPNAEGFYLRMGCQRVGAAVSRLTGSERVLPVLSYMIPAAPAAVEPAATSTLGYRYSWGWLPE